MTTDRPYKERTRDIQDGLERHVWGDLQYGKAGALLRIRGTGTTDERVPVLNFGYSFNVPSNYNTEVFALSDGSDVGQKFALPTLPRDKQRQWKENAGGVQNPVDPNKAVEFNNKRTHVTQQEFAVGPGGVIEVIGDTVYIRGNMIVSGNLIVNGFVMTGGVFRGPGTPIGGAAEIPEFEP